MNSNSKPNLNLNKGKEMKDRKKKKKKKWASQPAARLRGPASPSVHARGPASRPRMPLLARAPNSPASYRCHLAPRVSHTSPTPARFPVSLAAAATGPHASATLQHSVVFLTHASTAYATDARQRWQGGLGGHARGMALSLPCAAPTPPHTTHWMPPNTSPPLDRHPSWEHEARL